MNTLFRIRIEPPVYISFIEWVDAFVVLISKSCLPRFTLISNSTRFLHLTLICVLSCWFLINIVAKVLRFFLFSTVNHTSRMFLKLTFGGKKINQHFSQRIIWCLQLSTDQLAIIYFSPFGFSQFFIHFWFVHRLLHQWDDYQTLKLFDDKRRRRKTITKVRKWTKYH